MIIDEVKKMIEDQTGTPAELLTGKTAEENIAIARNYLAYRKSLDNAPPKTTREQFSAWLSDRFGDGEPQDEASAALDRLSEAVRVEAGGYPVVNDSGEVDASKFSDSRPTWQQFEEWINEKSAFNPFKG